MKKWLPNPCQVSKMLKEFQEFAAFTARMNGRLMKRCAWISMALLAAWIIPAGSWLGAAEVAPVAGASLEEVVRMADEGNAMAQDILALRYVNGEGVPKNLEEAYKWFRRAALLGYATSQYNLGLLYQQGMGVEKDLSEAARWFKEAAAQEHAAAQVKVAEMHQSGKGLPQSDRQAFIWFRKAASNGSIQAAYELGLIYQYAHGTDRDEKKFVEYYLKAAQGGHVLAQIAMGNLYDAGEGVPKDDGESIRWYRRAANQGNPAAQNNLAVKLAPSLAGNPHTNVEESYKWFNLAASQGVEYAARSRERLRLRMTPEEIDRAEKASLSFIAIPEIPKR